MPRRARNNGPPLTNKERKKRKRLEEANYVESLREEERRLEKNKEQLVFDIGFCKESREKLQQIKARMLHACHGCDQQRLDSPDPDPSRDANEPGPSQRSSFQTSQAAPQQASMPQDVSGSSASGPGATQAPSCHIHESTVGKRGSDPCHPTILFPFSQSQARQDLVSQDEAGFLISYSGPSQLHNRQSNIQGDENLSAVKIEPDPSQNISPFLSHQEVDTINLWDSDGNMTLTPDSGPASHLIKTGYLSGQKAEFATALDINTLFPNCEAEDTTLTKENIAGCFDGAVFSSNSSLHGDELLFTSSEIFSSTSTNGANVSFTQSQNAHSDGMIRGHVEKFPKVECPSGLEMSSSQLHGSSYVKLITESPSPMCLENSLQPASGIFHIQNSSMDAPVQPTGLDILPRIPFQVTVTPEASVDWSSNFPSHTAVERGSTGASSFSNTAGSALPPESAQGVGRLNSNSSATLTPQCNPTIQSPVIQPTSLQLPSQPLATFTQPGDRVRLEGLHPELAPLTTNPSQEKGCAAEETSSVYESTVTSVLVDEIIGNLCSPIASVPLAKNVIQITDQSGTMECQVSVEKDCFLAPENEPDYLGTEVELSSVVGQGIGVAV